MLGEYSRANKRQTELEYFWADAEAQIWNHGDDIIACRLRELGVSHELNMRGLVGVAHTDQITKICAELGRLKPKNIRAGGASVVFPYYDLPGRFTGVLLAQYNDEFDVRYHFVPASGYKKRRPEAGYFLTKLLLNPQTEQLKNTQFILDDPCWALQLQCKNLQRNSNTLPVVAGYTGAEANSYGLNWLSMPAATKLFQSHATSPELISRACTARGYVCIVKPLHKRTHDQDNPLKQLAHIRSHAETWQTNLTNNLQQMSELSAHSFATRLTIPPDKLGPFLTKISSKFSAGFADRVLRHAAVAAPLGTVQTSRRWMVTPRSDGWWSCTNHRICSANVVINKIIYADNGDKTYGGIIYLDGEQFEFSDSANKIENMGLLAYAQAYMAARKKLVVFDRTWNRRSHLISIELNKPELINVSGRFGWDEHSNVFRFANYELATDGNVVPAVLPDTRNRAISFPEPTPVAPPSVRQFLTPSYENAFVWTVFAAIVADLIAPIVRRSPTGTCIPGNNFDTAVRIGTALGCGYIQSSLLQKQHVCRQLTNAIEKTDWPLFASNAFDEASYSVVIPKLHNTAVFVRLAQNSAAVAPSYGWQIINGRAPAINTDFSPLRYVLPAYIQRALQNRMNIAVQNKNTARAVLADLHIWLQETYENSFQLDYALNQFVTENDAHTALFSELNNGICAGRLAVLPHPRGRKQPINYLVRKKEHWWLNQKAIDRYFYTCKTIAPNWLLITELITKIGAFLGEELVRDLPGLLISTQWGDRYLLHDTNNEARETG